MGGSDASNAALASLGVTPGAYGLAMQNASPALEKRSNYLVVQPAVELLNQIAIGVNVDQGYAASAVQVKAAIVTDKRQRKAAAAELNAGVLEEARITAMRAAAEDAAWAAAREGMQGVGEAAEGALGDEVDVEDEEVAFAIAGGDTARAAAAAAAVGKGDNGECACLGWLCIWYCQFRGAF